MKRKYIISITIASCFIVTLIIYKYYIHNKDAIFNKILEGDLSYVKYFCENNSNVDIKDYKERTPLHYASIVLNLDIIKCLISSGANVNSADRNGRTPLFYAILVGDVPDGDIMTRMDENLYHTEDKKMRDSVIRYLLASGADINKRDIKGNTLLHFAHNFPNLELLEYIIKNIDDLNAMNHQQKTPIFFASGIVIDLMVKYGSDVNVKDHIGKTPLHYRVMRNYLADAEILI